LAGFCGREKRPWITYFKPLAKWAARRGLMQNGFGELERPAQSQKKQLALSQVDVAVLLRSLSGSSRDIAVRMMLVTGARLNEVCLAKWREVDFARATWTLAGSRRKNVRPGRLMPDHVIPLPTHADRLSDRLDMLEAGGNVVALPRRA
jgi:integrase